MIERELAQMFESFGTLFSDDEEETGDRMQNSGHDRALGRAWGLAARGFSERQQAADQGSWSNEALVARTIELEQQNHDLLQINKWGEVLQLCQDVEEVYPAVEMFAGRVFPGFSGALYRTDPGYRLVEAVAAWGDYPPANLVFAMDDCWGLRSGHMYVVGDSRSYPFCGHLEDNDYIAPYLCLPLIAYGETIGMLHLMAPPDASCCLGERWEQLAVILAKQTAMALANLRLREELKSQSIRDPLTGLFNRRYMEETLERELRRAQRHDSHVGLVMIDIDRFKVFNDAYGHDVGDRMLCTMGEFLQSNIRQEDVACRYGGDEFVLILPGATLEETAARARHLQEGAKALTIQCHDREVGAISISVGISSCPENSQTAQELFRVADETLLKGKREGRD